MKRAGNESGGDATGEAVATPWREPGQLSGKLAGLSLPRQVMVLAIWPFMEQVLNLTVGTVDLALAGRLNPEAMAVAGADALGVGTFIQWLMGIVSGSVGVGATALIARAIGGRHRRLANAALGQSLLLAVIVGSLMAGIIAACAYLVPPLLELEPLAATLTRRYLLVLALGGPFHALLMIGNAALRGAGDTRTPFFVMLLINVVNVAASLLLVWGPAPIGGHDVAGIAGGTVIAVFVGAAAIVIALLKGRDQLRLRLHRLKPHRHTLARLGRVGLPNLLETLGGTWLATSIVLYIVGQIPGQGLIGAHMIAIRVESFSFQPSFALGIAAATLVGQYLGANNPVQARKAVALCFALAAGLMSLAGVGLVLIPHLLVRIFTDAPALIEQATEPVRISGFIQPFFAAYLVFSQALRGAGDTKTTMKLTYLSVFLVRVPGAFVLGHVMGLGLVGVWLALCGELVVRGSIFAGRFLHGGWAKVEV